jgi:hypothetical protein
MGANPEQDPQRAAKLEEATERVAKQALVMVDMMGPHDAAGVILAAIWSVLSEELGSAPAHALLTQVIAGLELRDPAAGAGRN